MHIVKEALKHKFTAVLITILLFSNFLWFVVNLSRSETQSNKAAHYTLLAKRLFLESPSDTIINFEPLRKELKQYLTNSGLQYSFYFEYLFTGSNIRIGEDNKLVGASLMKIPLVMDLYKAAEKGKINLDKEVAVPANIINNDKQFGNQEKLKPGDSISLREAAMVTLVESDNTAATIVFEATQGLLPPDEQALNNLDIETEIGDSGQGEVYLIDARSYSSFLKCLYFSCFLTLDDSQEILGYLTSSTDSSRISAGVPDEVTVAHKIGSFSNITQSDCGIVFVPDRRYVLCAMFDADTKTTNQHIKKISGIVYKYVTNVNAGSNRFSD